VDLTFKSINEALDIIIDAGNHDVVLMFLEVSIGCRYEGTA